MIPVFVCVPSSSMKCGDDGVCIVLDEKYHVDEPVGMLSGFGAQLDLCDFRTVERDLAPHKVSYTMRRVRAENGCAGVLVTFAVHVSTMEAALQLPGFVAFGYWSGAYYLPPKIDFSPSFDQSDKVEGVPIKRCDVRDAYDNFEPPKYNESGAFVLSMIPMGKLESCIFLQEDPMHIYVFRRDGRAEDDEIALARKLLDRSR